MRDFYATRAECKLFSEYLKHLMVVRDAQRQFDQTSDRLLQAIADRMCRKSWFRRPPRGAKWTCNPKANPRTGENRELRKEIRLSYKKPYREKVRVWVEFGLTPRENGGKEARFYTYLYIWPLRRTVEALWEVFMKSAMHRRPNEVSPDPKHKAGLFYRVLRARDPHDIFTQGVSAVARTCRDSMELARRFSGRLG